MENSPVFSTKIIGEIFSEIGEIFPDIWQYYELNKKMIKRDKLPNSILEIINKLAAEDDIFKNIDKIQLYEFLYYNIDILPHDITKKDLYRRIRKVMVIEAMSKLFDGYPEGLKLFEERRKHK